MKRLVEVSACCDYEVGIRMGKCEFACYLWSEIEVKILLPALVRILLLNGCFRVFVLALGQQCRAAKHDLASFAVVSVAFTARVSERENVPHADSWECLRCVLFV